MQEYKQRGPGSSSQQADLKKRHRMSSIIAKLMASIPDCELILVTCQPSSNRNVEWTLHVPALGILVIVQTATFDDAAAKT